MLSPLFVGALAVAGALGAVVEASSERAAADPMTIPFPVPAVYRVPELRAPDLPDAAMAEMTGEGPVILFNPEICAHAGAALEFVRAHEYAHVLLGHLVDA